MAWKKNAIGNNKIFRAIEQTLASIMGSKNNHKYEYLFVRWWWLYVVFDYIQVFWWKICAFSVSFPIWTRHSWCESHMVLCHLCWNGNKIRSKQYVGNIAIKTIRNANSMTVQKYSFNFSFRLFSHRFSSRRICHWLCIFIKYSLLSSTCCLHNGSMPLKRLKPFEWKTISRRSQVRKRLGSVCCYMARILLNMDIYSVDAQVHFTDKSHSIWPFIVSMVRIKMTIIWICVWYVRMRLFDRRKYNSI